MGAQVKFGRLFKLHSFTILPSLRALYQGLTAICLMIHGNVAHVHLHESRPAYKHLAEILRILGIVQDLQHLALHSSGAALTCTGSDCRYHVCNAFDHKAHMATILVKTLPCMLHSLLRRQPAVYCWAGERYSTAI